jgi:hypothetical protein
MIGQGWAGNAHNQSQSRNGRNQNLFHFPSPEVLVVPMDPNANPIFE